MYIIIALTILITGVLLPPDTYADGHQGNWHGGNQGNWHGGNHGNWHGGNRGNWHGASHGYWHGNYHDDNDFLIGLGLGFALPLFAYGYPYYGYPYYVPAPAVYTAPAQLPPAPVTPDQRSYNSSREEAAYCREYTKKIMVNGHEEMAYGTACLQGNGSWRIMN